MHGRRTALPRHQTLMATLDWSYETLGEQERASLRRLGIFAGAFDLDAASAVIDEEQGGRGAVIEPIADLVAKALVTADVSVASVRCRVSWSCMKSVPSTHDHTPSRSFKANHHDPSVE
jgi:predicted ATPase